MAMTLRMLAAVALACFACIAGAQSYPGKPVRVLIGFSPGSEIDTIGRLVAAKMGEGLGQPLVVENRLGAGGTLAAAAVASAAPDGYTLLINSVSHAAVKDLYKNLPFDTIKDFAPVSLTHLTPYVFVVSSQSPVKSLQELIRYIKDNAGKITYGTTGDGSPQQLATLLFAQTAGGLGKMTEVPYKGSSAAHPDLISNRISFMIDPLAAAGPHIKAGTLRALAVTTPQRNPSFPEIPTATESGVPGYDFSSWGGVFAPAGTPRAIVEKLNAEIGAALANPDLRKRFTDMGLVAKHSTPDELGQFLQSEMTRWRAVLAKNP
jgi:tripartite-type tricarboxylate transporter receptor subunit TctC